MVLTTHLPVLIVLLPLSAALLCTFLSKIMGQLGKILVIASLAASFLCSAGLLYQVFQTGEHTIHYYMGNWAPPIGIEFVIDPLNGILTVFLTFIALCTSVYCICFVQNKSFIQSGGFYALLGLLTVGLCGMTLTGDVFNLYVFLEVSSLSCYGLVAMGGKRSVLAAFRYLLIGTIGASFYLMAIGLLYALTGTLNMADMAALLQGQMHSPLVILACACLVGAFGIKMAIFPFHIWQPDAYSYAHPGASALISGAMSKVPAFAMIRFFFFIFGIRHWIIEDVTEILGILGAVGMIFGSLMAIRQTDFRRMLAYSSVAQLGYVALGIGIGNLYGVTGSFLHILNHIFMKGGLFLIIGAIQYRFGIVDIRHFGQLHKKMPVTCFSLVIASLAMVGIPPAGGFFSKWYLLTGAMDRQLYIYMFVLIASSLLNAVYFLRVLEKIFISPASAELSEKGKVPKHLELPLTMLIPLLIFGIGNIAMGILNSGITSNLILPTLQGVF
ncbi:Multiple resistance and pH homeostasis protein D [uncultured Roseburia sp.]|uniref:Monovalent cation/H+ antiporter subunit D family protein n=1 Tax=Brotonthovivens ammoniilytica TaxID=2981725 RepID=A0ABT2TM24_9FIRM|nr:monovalent cation/H+ antiporter subunit D family protein [Brotonthovivens ammoniilytica]MCU6763137.1 monovalent cation/H+ antiporter subunit D family protein [Brotonthovivens ammoniilytica]SCJ04435.1 Multiple resistance and pH homeostasis protein D [uncultured Roseburia sp.]